MVYSDSHAHLDSFPQEDLDIVFAQMKEKKSRTGPERIYQSANFR